MTTSSDYDAAICVVVDDEFSYLTLLLLLRGCWSLGSGKVKDLVGGYLD